MLTIGQLATYTGVTVRAVRHYHRIGLLTEPERDHSGYRRYDADAVIRLIRIRILADAGVPLARVAELIDAGPDTFADDVADIDAALAGEIARLGALREKLGQLASGERLALPESVVGYLGQLRERGVDDGYIAMERDAWILIAAQYPSEIDDLIARKSADLDDPEIVELYRLISSAFDAPADDPRIIDVVDTLDRILSRAWQSGDIDSHVYDERLVALLDDYMVNAAPAAVRILELLRERGWTGWTQVDRVGADATDASSTTES